MTAPEKQHTPTVEMLEVLEAHSSPKWNVAEEAWIPVRYRTQASVREVGLREALLNAHEIVDIAESDPLARASLRRFLEDITAALVLSVSTLHTYDWEERYEANLGFRTEDVDAFLAEISEFLFLYHPSTPFMQDIRLGTMTKVKCGNGDSFHRLLPHTPPSSSAWFFKPNDRIMREGISIPAAARGLLVRRFYALNGNSGGGDEGGTYAEGPATVTNAFRVDRTSLFRTLLSNLTPELLTKPRGGEPSGLAWLATGYTQGGTPLYQSSLSVAQTLLGAPNANSRIETILRASLGDGSLNKAARNAACDADRHAIVELASGRNGKPKRIRRAPGEHHVRMLHSLLNLSSVGERIRGVVLVRNVWLEDDLVREAGDEIELLLASKHPGGGGKSPKYAHVEVLRIPSFYANEQWQGRQALAELLSAALSDKKGLYSQLRTCIYRASNDDNAKSDNWALSDTAGKRWLDSLSPIVHRTVAGQLNSAEGIAAAKQSALAVFDQATEQLMGTANGARKVARQRGYLLRIVYRRNGDES